MTESEQGLATQIAQHVWQSRYRAGAEASVEATWRRVARTLAAVEPADRDAWEQPFLDILRDFQFLPGGRILAGAGVSRDITLFNCFVMGAIHDSIPGIFRALEEGAVTMHRGGGVGYDFSTLRPRGARSRSTDAVASGPVPFMDVWDAMCATIQSTGARRGAMMATLRCDHPDIAAFIDAKRQPGRLRHFNLSVMITDAFMQVVADDADWPLTFGGRIIRVQRARQLWERLLRASYDTSEPGILFIDRINRLNNLWYCEHIAATNPCGEIPLPPYGACNLGAINLTRFVRDPFTPQACFDTERLVTVATTAVRMLDNVIDASSFPLPQQQEAVRKARRIGLGITGLADALAMLGLRYGSDASLAFAADMMRTICHTAYRQSIAIAEEKGSFPQFDRVRYLAGPFIGTLPPDLRDGIAKYGIRNSHLLAIAPTGTISLLAGNVSSGIEPVYSAEHGRTVLDVDAQPRRFPLVDYAVQCWREQYCRSDGVPDALITATELPIEAHLTMQATLQAFVDNSISKTINVPAATTFAAYAPIYRSAYDRGLKGCTSFRPVAAGDGVLAATA